MVQPNVHHRGIAQNIYTHISMCNYHDARSSSRQDRLLQPVHVEDGTVESASCVVRSSRRTTRDGSRIARATSIWIGTFSIRNRRRKREEQLEAIASTWPVV
jgi:hypothetical protein